MIYSPICMRVIFDIILIPSAHLCYRLLHLIPGASGGDPEHYPVLQLWEYHPVTLCRPGGVLSLGVNRIPVYHGGKIHNRDDPCGGSGGKWIVATQVILGSGGKYKAGCEQVLPYHPIRRINRATFAVLMERGKIDPAIFTANREFVDGTFRIR